MKSLTRKSLYGVYPDGFSKMQKCSLRRFRKSYKLEARKLYHIDTLQDGTLFNGVVKKNEAEN